MRPFPWRAGLVAFVTIVVTAPPAALASVDCAARPADAVSDWVRQVRADTVAVPTAAPAIAVLDTGVAAVPELEGRLRPGYNVVNGSQLTNDSDGHGTAVATIAAGAGAIRGVSPTSPIVPIKIFDDRGLSDSQDFVAAVERAVAADAGVINVSGAALASDVDPADAREIRDAIYSAVSLGIPVVAPSGNEGASSLAVPAAYPHVIAVGASDPAGARAAFSNLGSGLDLMAPGVALSASAPHPLCSSGFGTFTGTSFASPIVAGAAALLLAKHHDLDGAQLADLLRAGGRPSPPLDWSPETGFGLLDVARALDAPVPAPDLPEVNDDISWAKLQPALLSAPRRSRTAFARIAPHLDPVDVYRLRLKKGDRLSVRAKAPSGTRLQLSFGSRALARKGGTKFAQKIKRSGTYYVGVSIAESPPAGSGYALSVQR